MKIEIGESLFYSWLRHVKGCQIVQTNWKPSPEWEWQHEESLEELMRDVDKHFEPDFDIFKKTRSLSQMITQAEIDVLGLAFEPELAVYAVDVAFHERGLNYGDTQKTVSKVIQKCARSAICLRACFGVSKGEIVFASPKIDNRILKILEPSLQKLNAVLGDHKLEFNVRLIANDEFYKNVLKQILDVSEGVSDTTELFIRAYQLTNLFEIRRPIAQDIQQAYRRDTGDPWSEIKIGKLASTVLRQTLGRGIDPNELVKLQESEYSKNTFGINYPLLFLQEDTDHVRKTHYYRDPVKINGKNYLMCQEWFENPNNNDRPQLIAWLLAHQAAV